MPLNMLCLNDIAAFHEGYLVANDRKFREIVDYVRDELRLGFSVTVRDANPRQCERIAKLCAPCWLSISLREPARITIMPICGQAREHNAGRKRLFLSSGGAEKLQT